MGFPSRPSRAAFGPTYRNRFAVTEDDTEMGADIVNLSAWQIAGAGLMVPAAWCVVDGATGDLIAAAECWDPDLEFEPATERVDDGVYMITYPATAPDEQGNDVAISLVGADISIGGTDVFAAPAVARWRIEAGRIIHVETRQAAASADPSMLLDVPRFLLKVY